VGMAVDGLSFFLGKARGLRFCFCIRGIIKRKIWVYINNMDNFFVVSPSFNIFVI
jgi:hypothetical protein